MDFSAFDTTKLDEYAAQAKAQWGETEAYREYEQKSKGRTQTQDQALAAGMMELFAAFGNIKRLPPSAGEARELVARLQSYITKHYYTCTDAILLGLAQMYESGGDFTANIDKAGGKGTAQFAADAIRAYCKGKE